MNPGRLPAGAAEQMARQIEGWKSSGSCSCVELLAGPECDVAAKHNGERYAFDSIPELPFSGCTRHPCCACGFLPVIVEKKEKMALWKKTLVWIGGAWIAAVLASFLLSGCAGTPFKWADARTIEAGMTKPEVTAKLGAPTRVSTIQNDATRYVWVWVNTLAGSTRTLVIDFDKSGRVIKAPPIPEEFQD